MNYTSLKQEKKNKIKTKTFSIKKQVGEFVLKESL